MVYIYSLSDPKTKEVKYIGKTTNPQNRFYKHSNEMKTRTSNKDAWLRDIYPNKPLFDVIDVCDDDNWEYWEKFWIKTYNSWGYELTNTTIGGKGVGKEPEKVSIYNIEGKLIKIVDSILDAVDFSGIHYSVIHRQCNMKRVRAGNNEYFFRWTRNNIEFIEKVKMETNNKVNVKPVLQYTKEGIFVKEWENTKAIIKNYEGCSRTGIQNCCQGFSKSHKGYIFKYKQSKN